MTDILCTNGDVWLAVSPNTPGKPSAVNGLLSWPMRAKSSRAAQKLARKLAEAFNDIDGARLALCKTYAKKDADGNPEQGPTGFVIEDVATFSAEWTELLAEKIALKDCRPIEDREIDAAAKPTPNEIIRLGPFLVESAE